MFPIGQVRMAILSSVVKVLWPLFFLFHLTDNNSNMAMTQPVMASDFQTWSGVARLGAVRHLD